MAGLWLWGLSIWFFLVSVGSLWKYLRPESKGKLRFQMTWFSFVFPNTALVSLLSPLPRIPPALSAPFFSFLFGKRGDGDGDGDGEMV